MFFPCFPYIFPGIFAFKAAPFFKRLRRLEVIELHDSDLGGRKIIVREVRMGVFELILLTSIYR